MSEISWSFQVTKAHPELLVQRLTEERDRKMDEWRGGLAEGQEFELIRQTNVAIRAAGVLSPEVGRGGIDAACSGILRPDHAWGDSPEEIIVGVKAAQKEV